MSECNYCGEAEGTEKIVNPNAMSMDIEFDDPQYHWIVCKDCSEIIPLQQRLTFASMLGHEDQIEKIEKQIQEITNRTGVPCLTASIQKVDDGIVTTEQLTEPEKDGN